MTNRCPNCGAPHDGSTATCEYCGTQFGTVPPAGYQPAPSQPQPSRTTVLPKKSRGTAAVLALLLGGFGVHKFYLGRTKAGILMLLFCWTYIPAIIGVVECFVLLSTSDRAFVQKYNCRIK